MSQVKDGGGGGVLTWDDICRWRGEELTHAATALHKEGETAAHATDSFRSNAVAFGWQGTAATAAERSKNRISTSLAESVADLESAAVALRSAAHDVSDIERRARAISDDAASHHLVISSQGAVSDGQTPPTFQVPELAQAYTTTRTDLITGLSDRVHALMTRAVQVDRELASALENVRRTGTAGTATTGADALKHGGDAARAANDAFEFRTSPERLLGDCDRVVTTYTGKAEVTAFSVTGSNGVLLVRSEYVDNAGVKHWKVQLVDTGEAGIKIMEGEKVKLGGAGENASIDLAAVLTAESGRTWNFDSAEQADNFARDAAAITAGKKVGALMPGGLLTGPALDKVLELAAHGALTETYQQLGAKVQAEGSAPVVVPGVSGSMEGAIGVKTTLPAALIAQSKQPGSKITPDDIEKNTERTVYYKGGSALSAELLEGGVSGKAAGDVTIGVTYKDGKPIKAALEGNGTAGLDTKSSLSDIAKAKIPGSPEYQGSNAMAAKYNYELDLTRPENKAVIDNVLRHVGTTVATGGSPGSLVGDAAAARQLAHRFTDAGPAGGATATRSYYTSGTDGFSGSAEAGEGETFGGGLTGTREEKRLVRSERLDPDEGWTSWQTCSPAK